LELFIHYAFKNHVAIVSEWHAAKADAHYLQRAFPSYGKRLRLVWSQMYKRGKPIDYVLGWTPFLGMRFRVRSPVLIPRQDTESWLKSFIKDAERLQNGRDLRILEVGTGSGCIAIALAKNLPCHVTAIDKSDAAVKLAHQNVMLNSVTNLVIKKCNVFDDEAVRSLRGPFDLLISNPPYIPQHHWSSLVSPNVRRWESTFALLGGVDGCDFHRRLLDMATMLDIGAVVLELDGSESQVNLVQNIATTKGYRIIQSFPDTANRTRAIILSSTDA
jgi:release factor glutamine methyltransferase